MRAHAAAVLTPAYAALVRSTKQPFIQPIADHLSPQFAFGRVVLIGDAAAQARPHVGAGTTKALEDAAALVAALADHVEISGALRAYEQARLGSAQRMVDHGRWLGRHLDPTMSGDGEDQAPGTLLGKTARPATRPRSLDNRRAYAAGTASRITGSGANKKGPALGRPS